MKFVICIDTMYSEQYGISYEVHGPFDTREEAEKYMEEYENEYFKKSEETSPRYIREVDFSKPGLMFEFSYIE